MTDAALNAVLEIFTWVGFGLGGALLLLCVILTLADGSWQPVTVLLDDDEHGRVARWFGPDGEVNQARLTHDQEQALAGKDRADAFARRHYPGRMRLTAHWPLARFLTWLGAGLVALGLLSLVLSWVLLFVAG